MTQEAKTITRYRMGQPHPVDASLVFFRRNKGKDVWVTPEKLAQKRTVFGSYADKYYKRPDVREKIRANYHADPEVRRKIMARRNTPKGQEIAKKALAKWRASSMGKEYKKKYYGMCKQNPHFRILVNCRSRVYDALRNTGIKKQSKTKDLLGCSFEFFRGWLESQFKRGMSWQNYGIFWHVDHKRPCASYDLTDPEQQKACFHYSNTQPLWKELNLSKGCKILN